MGFHISRNLRLAGHEVTVFDNLARRGSELNISALADLDISFIHGDIRRLEDLDQTPRDFNCVIECSAQASVVSGYVNPVYDFATNTLGVIHCLELCRKQNAGMIFLSSSRVFPAEKINAIALEEKATRWDWKSTPPPEGFPRGFHPDRGIDAGFDLDGPTKTIYGASKAAADFFCQEYADAFGLPVVVNRCGVISGEGQFGHMGQGWLAHWAISCLLERPVTYLGFKGKQVRDILFIADLCDLIERQLDSLDRCAGKVWNVGGGRSNSISLMEATELFQRLMNRRMVTSVSEEIRKGDVIVYITDNSRVSADLGWAPAISLEQGAQKLAEWVSDRKSELVACGL